MALMGTLYVVGTPIGNLEDITLRALRVLREVDVIACEDTRHARTLLQRHGIATPLVSYHEHNERERAPQLVRRLLAGEGVALITDAGVPAISDPGFHLITQAIAAGVPVIPIPGPSAVTAALSVAGLPVDRFLFLGFPPRTQKARRRALEEGGGVRATQPAARADEPATYLRRLLNRGMSRRDAARSLAETYGISHRKAYQMALELPRQ